MISAVNISTFILSVKVKFALEGAMKALHGGGWSTPLPGRFTPGNDPVPII
jgi:hypothetical protein